MTDTVCDQTQVVLDKLAAVAPAPESDHEAVQGPVTELEANMPLLKELQQRLHSEFAHHTFGRHPLEAAVRSLFGQNVSQSVLNRKLRLGDGFVHETFVSQACVQGVLRTHRKYRVILTAEQSAAAAAAAAEAEAQRDAARQKAAADEEALLKTLKQFADVPKHGTDLNGARELVMERRRMELRVSDRMMQISPSEAFVQLHLEGLGYEHYVQPVKDSSEAYVRLVLKYLHPVKKSPSQVFKMLADALDMVIVPESEAAAAKAKEIAAAKKEFQQGDTGLTLEQYVRRKYFRVSTAYAYAVPEGSEFYDLAEKLQHQVGEFRTDQDRDMATRKALTTDAHGKDFTQKVWKDKIIELTSTVADLKVTIESLESDTKRQKAELESLNELKDWELQEDGTMIKVNRTDEEELERMLEEQAAAEAEEEELCRDYC